MSKLLDLLKSAGGEAQLSSRLGQWRLAASILTDAATAAITALVGDVGVLEADVNTLEADVNTLEATVSVLSGGGMLPATGTTQGARPLDGYDTTLLEDGSTVFVEGGINEWYYFSAASALVADGLNVVDPGVGPGQFLRSDSVIVQADWYVDSVAGDDENPGTVALPLLTQAELTKRLSGKVLWSSIPAATVNFLGTFPTEVLSLSGTTITRGQTLIFSGLATAVASGTITTYTARNAAADASATILADISFAGHAGRRIRLTSGANSGAVAYVLFDLGGNTSRVSGFGTAGGATVVPANGDTFDIETLDTVLGGVTIATDGGGVVRVDDVDIAAPTLNEPNYITPFVHLSPSATFSTSTGVFNRCRFSGANTTLTLGGGLYNCVFSTPLGTRGGRYMIRLGAMVGGNWTALFSLLNFSDYFCFEGVSAALDIGETSSLVQVADLQFFRCSGAFGLRITASTCDQTASVRIYGGSNTFTNAMLVRAACYFAYQNKPTITGNNPGVNDIKLGGVDLGWAAIPTITVANNAAAVLRV